MCVDKKEQDANALVRLEVNLNRETADALQELSRTTGASITEVIRRSISIYKFVKDEQDADREIRTRDRKGREKIITFVD